MTEPLVCCIMLTKDRPEMARRAVESFRRQTYQNKRLAIADNGTSRNTALQSMSGYEIVYGYAPEMQTLTIGTMRNVVNGTTWATKADIHIHWDSDDWSHPNRIAEQVALLQASGKQCVGYRDMLFWKEPCVFHTETANLGVPYSVDVPGEAWLYTNQDPRYCLGTSLCYWRAAWEARPFPDISRGEDRKWLREIDSMGITIFPPFDGVPVKQWDFYDQAPRMIASIHSGNHVKYETTSAEWTRVPEWDAYCRERMAL